MIEFAFQGERGANSEAAGMGLLGKHAQGVPCRTFSAVVEAVHFGSVARGVLPISNSTIGPIVDAVAALESANLLTIDELSLPIHHYIVGVRGAQLPTITRVLSHPAALAQCTRFFDEYDHIKPVKWYDTAGAARDVATARDSGTAALATLRCAEIYSLDVIAEEVEDIKTNTTTFILIARQ